MVSADRIYHHTFIGSWLGKDALVVDLGMNAGTFAHLTQSAYGCRILGVEPNPTLHARIKQTEALKCFNWAIAKQSGEVEFWINENNSEESSLHTHTGTPIRVLAKSFPDFCSELGIGEIDLLKVDIEGAEIELLEDNAETFHRVRQLSVEFHPFLWPEHRVVIRKIIRQMQTKGFHVVDFSRDFTNVLFVNEAFGKLSAGDKLHLVTHKFGSALHRMGRKYASTWNQHDKR